IVPSSAKRLYLASLAASICVVLLQRKYYAYHFTTFYILLTPIAAIGVEWLLQTAHRRSSQGVIFASIVSVCWIISMPWEHLHKHWNDPHPILSNISTAYEDATWPDTSDAPTITYVESHTSISDRVEICSLDPRMRLHLHREPVGPYASLHAIGFGKDM